MKDKPVVFVGEADKMKGPMIYGAPARGRSIGIAPGTYPARILAMDYSRLEDHMAGVLARLEVDGRVIVEQVWHIPRDLEAKTHIIADMFDFKPVPGASVPNNRHHKRKPQPNRGPVGRKEW